MGLNGFEACKVVVNTFGLWLLVLKTHLYDFGYTKQRLFFVLAHVKQSGSHEACISELRAQAKLVVGAFESVEHNGFIKTYDILKVIYINGLDQVYFDRPINRLVENLPHATSEDAMQLCQQFSFDCSPGDAALSTSFSGKVLCGERG